MGAPKTLKDEESKIIKFNKNIFFILFFPLEFFLDITIKQLNFSNTFFFAENTILIDRHPNRWVVGCPEKCICGDPTICTLTFINKTK